MNGKRVAVIGALAIGLAANSSAFSGAEPAMCSAGGAVDFGSVHPQDAALSSALADGLERSATLRGLVRRIQLLNGVVFLAAGPWRNQADRTVFSGGMAHTVAVRGQWRILFGRVEPSRGDATIATIGHELRHAVEILETPGIVDAASIERLYERIGFETHAGAYETENAGRAERAVRSELSRCRRVAVTNR